MISWQEEKPDIEVLPWEQFPREDLKIPIEELNQYLNENKIIFVKNDIWEKIFQHGKSSYYEVGGLLLGYVFKREFYVWYIDDIVYSDHYISSSTHLVLYPELWQVANRKILDENGKPIKFILGWYHTHPGFTPFFSTMDRTTHQNFFSFEYSLGLVIDPFSEKIKIYIGKNFDPYANDVVVTQLF